MKRLVIEIGLGMMVLVLLLEVIHYRNAVIAANLDNKRAWQTVIELREKNEDAGHSHSASRAH